MITFENNVMSVKGRIDSTNAADFEKELFALYTSAPVTLDAEKLEYISSAGLRVLLKLHKQAGSVTVVNVSPEVYDILEVTGFTEILTVKKALRFVSVKGLELLGQGGHGRVYKLSEDMIIKVYRDNCTLEDIEQERQFARSSFLSGVPCAIAFDTVRCEDGYGVIFEMAGAQTLSSAIEAHPEKLQEYAVKFAALLKTLNTCPAGKTSFGSIQELYAQRLQAASVFFTEEENAVLMRVLNTIPQADTLVHGDYHPNNVMVTGDGELLLIDMADMSWGNPLFDVGGTCLMLLLMGRRNPAVTKMTIGMEHEHAVQMWGVFVSRYYGITDPQHVELLTNRCIAFALLRMAASLGMDTEGSRQFAPGMVNMLRESFFPNAEGFTRLLAMDI